MTTDFQERMREIVKEWESHFRSGVVVEWHVLSSELFSVREDVPDVLNMTFRLLDYRAKVVFYPPPSDEEMRAYYDRRRDYFTREIFYGAAPLPSPMPDYDAIVLPPAWTFIRFLQWGTSDVGDLLIARVYGRPL